MKWSLTIKEVKTIFYGILCGIKYTHSGEIIHRDLSPVNIMVNADDMSTRLVDFGMSRSSKIKERENSGYVGIRWYRAPEVILIEKYLLKASDMWSLGCILAELLRCIPAPGTIGRTETMPQKALFPGDNCFPMDRKKVQDPIKIGDYTISEQDQLLLILKTIGSPKAEDIQMFSDLNARKYLSGFDYKAKDLKDLFPPYLSSDPEGPLDLLKKLLRFQPFERFTAN